MNIKQEKYLILTILFIVNTVLSTTFIIYENKWYVFLFILALASITNSLNSILLIFYKMFIKKEEKYRTSDDNYIYLVPCYNESKQELKSTLDSLDRQLLFHKDNKLLIIICDGKVKGSGNNKSTDRILTEDILNNTNNNIFIKAYKSWDGEYNNLDIYNGKYKSLNYILLIKDKNIGKRDGLTLIRKLLYTYNKTINNNVSINYEFLKYFHDKLSTHFNNEKIDYIIGTDADTVFDELCTEQLLKTMHNNNKTVGCVGFVDISPECNKYSLYTLYQYAEYIYAQCLKRQQQSNITNKVSCLSGCVQILKICEETCSDYILDKFNYLPKEEENIFNHIRSYASEDRNHVCLMLSEYPYVETRQNLDAIAYTKIPMNYKVFLSQRRRWSLGANCNDMLLVKSPHILIYERISAFINIITYAVAPFIFISTILFIRSIITNNSILMLLLSIVILIPVTYGLLIPIFIKQMSFKQSIYYYLSMLVYFSIGSVINLIIYINSVINMDIIKWGKTRSVVEENREEIRENNRGNQDEEIISISIV